MVTRRWTNASVRRLAAGGDPEDVIVRRARDFVFRAIEAGWSGPPFDPFELATLRGIEVVPSQMVVDARISARAHRLRIEYNPDQPRARQRYSIAHELAHALFPDVAAQVRFRTSGQPLPGDEWQLELLCNLGAAELLMPIGSLSETDELATGIDGVLALRHDYQVSVEAVALRLVKLARRPLLVFAAAPMGPAGSYRIDYAVPSKAWDAVAIPRILANSVVAECTAVGYTAKRNEAFGTVAARVEAVGIPPYPGDRLPRVVGVVHPLGDETPTSPGIEYVRGDATEPRGRPAIIVQVVNDKTPNWGGGFALEVRNRWPVVQDEFRVWAEREGRLVLGAVHFAEASVGLWVANIVAMHGYGPSPTPRIRYAALEQGLISIRERAYELSAGVHAPRIGAGQARGSWSVVAGLIDETLSSAGIPVTVYDLPGAGTLPNDGTPQLSLGFGAAVSNRT